MKNFLRVALLFLAISNFSNLSAQPGCPAVNAGVDVNIPCNQTCTNLTANAFSAAQTTAYTVASIPYTPPFPFNSGNAILVNVDDTWSNVINLPFNFCFFGSNNTQLVVGSNGVVSFNVANANTGSGYVISGPIPASAGTNMYNSIMGPWQDIDPTFQGQIFYQVTGAAPCRIFEVSWYRIPYYGDPNSVSTGSCNSALFATQQIVLYETTNAIEIYINNKEVCSGWNGGRAVEGILNAAGNTAYTVPGRNGTQWTAQNDAYRFTPAGAPNFTIAWFDGLTQIGTGSTIQVCPTTSRSYTAKATYTNCNSTTVEVTDDVFVGTSSLTVQTDSIHPIQCFGGTGDIYASFTSTGSSVLSYGWSPGGIPNSTSITGVGAGTYIFSATDATNCTKYDTVTLTQPTQLLANVPDTTIASCVGGNIGALTANASGGTGAYTYLWSNGGITQTISNIGAGTYTVTVTDANGCTATAVGNVVINTTTITFDQPVITDAICTSSTGSITVSSSGGTGVVTYNWSGGLPNGTTANGLASGTYSVTATDINGCSASASYTVNQTNPTSFGSPTIVDASCGNSNGSITVTVNGTTGTVNYSWSNGLPDSNTQTGLAAGSYSVTATDANGCTSSASYTVNQGVGISLGTPVITDILCGNAGSIVLNVVGGTAPINFAWSGGLPDNATVAISVAGTYSVTATDANGCTASGSYNVNQTVGISFGSPVITDITCGTAGTIVVTVNNATAPINFNWSAGLANNDTVSVLAGGTYSVTATDANGCTATASYTVNQTSTLVIDSASVNSVTCNGTGTVTVYTSGSNGTLTYLWSNGQSGSTLSVTTPGTYDVTISDQTGCSVTGSYIVGNVPCSGCPAIATSSSVTVPCGQTCTTLQASAYAGAQTTSYTVSQIPYSPVSAYNSGTPILVNVDDRWSGIINIPFGFCFFGTSHNQLVVGSNGAVSFNLANANTGSGYVIGAGGIPSATPTNLHNSIMGPWQDMDPTNQGLIYYNIIGTYPCRKFVVSWYRVPMFGDANSVSTNSCPNPIFQTQQIVLYETTNAIQVYIENKGVCPNWNSGRAIEGIQNAAGTVAYTVPGRNATQWTAQNDAWTFLPAGAQNYVVSWFLGGNQIGTGNSILVCPTANTTYGVQAVYTNCNGAQVTLTDTINVSVSGNPISSQVDSVHQITCFNGSDGAVYASFDTVGLQIDSFGWSPGGILNETSLTGISAGTYIFSVVTLDGCFSSDTVTLSNPPPFTVSVPDTAISTCQQNSFASLTAIPSGGTPGYTYGWSNQENTQTITNIGPGIYSVIVTDTLGCTATGSGNVTSTAGLTLNNPVITDATCGNINGSIVTSVSGGSGIITYNWSNNLPGNATVSGLAGGTYLLTVTDANGCSATASYTVNQTNAITLGVAVVTDASCGINNGSIALVVNGAINPINYNWSNSLPNSGTVTGLSGGTYSVTVTDGNGCSATASYTINQSAGISFGNPLITNIACGGTSGSIIVTVVGGQAPINYTWTSGLPNNDTVSGLSAGTYSVTATEANGCSATATYSINQSTGLTITNAVVGDVTCSGLGSIQVSVSGGTTPYIYTWSGGLSGNPATGVAEGGYSVTITDQTGCSVTGYYIVGNTPCGDCPAVATNNNVNLACGDTCVTLRATAVNGAQTTAYTVAQIPYSPPQPFNVGTPILVNVDDRWSNIINLPFNFCFFGATNNQLVVGSNGGISFDMANAGTGSGYLINGPIPSATPTNLHNSIMGPWHDMDPTNRGNIYYSIGGVYPCRSFTVSWYEVPMYGDPNSVSSSICPDPLFEVQQIVLYETTNAIDVYIQQKDFCGAWNNGRAIEGIQNATGTVAYTVPGRNATQWTAQNDAWRFSPAGAPNYIINWFQGGNLLGTGDSIQVCPAATSTYGVQAIYTNCDNSTITVNDSVIVNVSGVLTAQIDSVKNITCFGDNSGAVYASYTSTGGNISYGWSPGLSGVTSMTGLSAGTYVFTITNGAGCDLSYSAVVTEPSQLVVTVPDTSAYNCVSGSPINAVLNAAVSGGTPGYVYAWDGGAISSSISVSAAGTYIVTVTDTLGCTAIDSSTVSLIVASPVFNAPVITDPTCNGGSDGSIVVGVSQATPPLVYTWSNNLPDNDTVTGLAAGNYNVTATDANGCSVSATYNLNEPTPIVIGNPVITQATCTVGGTITVTASGGTGTLVFNWSNGENGSSIDSLLAGNYTITVTDANACNATASYTVTSVLGTVLIGVPVITNVTCNGGNNGSILASASGGTGTLLFSWSNQALGASISGLTAGNYTLTVTDQNGCSASASYDVTQPAAITVDSVVITQATCVAGGTIAIVTVSGGTGPYTYGWSNGDSGNSLDSLSAGPYTVTITDAVGCTATATFVVPASANVIAFGTPTVNNISCNGAEDGSITITITGGTPPDSIHWSTNASTATISGLSSGAYSVTITDATGCSASTTYSITEPSPVVLGSPTITQATCTVGGTISVTATGGTGTIIYSWSNGQSGSSLDSLAAGPYTLTVTDGNGCSVTATYTVPAAPGSVQFEPVVAVDLTCNGGSNGSIAASASGGTAPITFNWGGGIVGPVRTGLNAGTYSVTITDVNGCSASTSYTLNQPAAITVDSVVITQATCVAGGTITIVTVSGGTGPYSYGWSNGDNGNNLDSLAGGPYTVTITDAVGCTATATFVVPASANVIAFGTPTVNNISCNGAEDGSITITITGGTPPDSIHWSTNASTATISGLSSGAYSVTITDATGCSASTTYSITEPSPVVLGSPTITQATCTVGGTISVTATGGTGTIIYSWSNGQSGSSLDSLAAGPYTLTVTDGNGCSVTATYTVPAAPGSVQFEPVVITDASCAGNDGSITASASGGTAPITFNWGGGIVGPVRTGLSAGTYSVTITDVNNCSASTSYVVNGSNPITIDSVFATEASCQAGGTLTVVSVNGGTVVGYSFAWSNGDLTATADSLSAGVYTVTVSNNGGCSVTGTYNVTALPGTIQFGTPVIAQVRCAGGNTGSITATTINGLPPITFEWSNGDTTASTTGLTAGSYSVTISDVEGCSASAIYNITQPAALVPSIAASQLMCFGDSIGTATASATGGTGPYTYRWNTSATTQTITNQPVGVVVVTVTDANGCSASTTGFINQVSSFYYSSIIVQPSCANIGFGTEGLGPKGGGIGPFIVTVNGVGTDTVPAVDDVAYFYNLASGTYTFTITDSLGCSIGGSFDVKAGVANDSLNIIGDSATCTLSNGSLTSTPMSVANSPYTYSYDGGSSYVADSIKTGLGAGNYVVYVKNRFGCIDSISASITQVTTIDSFDVNVDSTTCFGDQYNDGSITLTPTTANGPYQYSINGSDFSADSSFTSLGIGTYTVYTINAAGCADTLSATVAQPLQVGVRAVPDTVLTAPGVGNTLLVNGTNFINPVYTWSPAEGLSSTDSAKTTATVSAYTVYYVTVSEQANRQCAAFDSIVVIVTGSFRMPNAFSPNGDGRNDGYSPVSFGLANIVEFRIYNRWGQLVHNVNEPWDGKLSGAEQPAGTYIFYITVSTPDENNPGAYKTEKQQGSFTLLR